MTNPEQPFGNQPPVGPESQPSFGPPADPNLHQQFPPAGTPDYQQAFGQPYQQPGPDFQQPYQQPAPDYHQPFQPGAPEFGAPTGQPGAPNFHPPTQVQPAMPGGPKKNRGTMAIIAALAVVVLVLGTVLVLKGGKSTPTAAAPSTVTLTPTAVTVTQSAPANSGGPAPTAPSTASSSATTPSTSAVAGGGGFAVSTSSATSSDTSDDSGDDSGSGASGAPIVGKVGTPLPLSWTSYTGTKATGSLTVNSVKRVTTTGGSLPEKPTNGVYMEVDITYTATTGSISYDSFDWSAKDAAGHQHSSTFLFDSTVASLQSGNITAGDKVRGVITFDVPAGAMSLIYAPDFSDSTTATWQLPA